MSLANSKKATSSVPPAAYAGAMARIRRGAGSSRMGRRSTLLNVLTSMYANSSRGPSMGTSEGRNQNAGTER
jgi:hypothetical protein